MDNTTLLSALIEKVNVKYSESEQGGLFTPLLSCVFSPKMSLKDNGKVDLLSIHSNQSLNERVIVFLFFEETQHEASST